MSINKVWSARTKPVAILLKSGGLYIRAFNNAGTIYFCEDCVDVGKGVLPSFSKSPLEEVIKHFNNQGEEFQTLYNGSSFLIQL